MSSDGKRLCKHCDKPFQHYPHDDRVHLYCSVSCRKKAAYARKTGKKRVVHVSILCPKCGESFTPFGAQLFCSSACRIKYRKDYRRGNPVWLAQRRANYVRRREHLNAYKRARRIEHKARICRQERSIARLAKLFARGITGHDVVVE